MGATFFFLSKVKAADPEKWPTWKPLIYELTFRNVMELREQLASTVGYLPTFWAFMIKQFIPHVVLILFINLAASNTDDGDALFGNYGDYINWPFQGLGYLTVIFAFGLFLIGFGAPDLYKGLTLLDEKALIHGYGQGTQVKELEKMGMDTSGKQEGSNESDAEEQDKSVEAEA
jgi:hypothetical protein